MKPTEQLTEVLFSDTIVQEYDLLKLICPLAEQMSGLVGKIISDYPDRAHPLSVVELGGGTGVTTLYILQAKQSIQLLSIDSDPAMQAQAKRDLQTWIDSKHLTFCTDDALSALQNMADNCVDIVASAYTLHNFQHNYREQVIQEAFRVLKPGGLFINADRYAVDDISEHLRLTQQDASHFFKVLIAANKPDLLEQWILHLFSDEAEHHIMRETIALSQMQQAGFKDIQLSHRMNVNALVTASKPTQEI